MIWTSRTLLLACLLAWLPVGAEAQQLPPPMIAVVNVEKVMRDSEASKSIRAQLENRRASYQDEISKREDELRTADEELAQQRAVLSAEQFGERQREFQTQVAETQRHVQNRKRQLDRGFADGMREVEKTIQQIAEDIANEKGANIVLTNNMVIYAVTAIDITETVLKRLNDQLPTVEVSISGE